MAKTSNSGGPEGSGNQKKKKKSKKLGPDSVAMKSQAPKRDNPFETIWSRRKFDILGKKRKGEELRVGLARSRAIDKRTKTLLKEYKQSGKSSVFVDNRIGEQDDALGEFDKAILRSQRERQLKVSKKSKYNLSDGEDDDDFDIPGLGGLSERDDFDEEIYPEDDDYVGEEGDAIEKDPFNPRRNSLERGQLVGDDNKHKTKKEVMEEIILKSKYHKAQRAKEKEENEQLMEDLDKNFSSLVQSKALLSVTDPKKMSALNSLVNKSIPDEQFKKDAFSAPQSAKTSNLEKADVYDKLVSEMAMEIRARPSDRTKTPEEIAQEERERLEALEEERQKRMLEADDLSDEEDENTEKPSAIRSRAMSGDDLGDSFTVDEEPKTKKGWVDEILERDAEDSGSDDGSEENSSDEDEDEDDVAREEGPSMKDWEQSDDELENSDQDDEEEKDDDDSSDDEKRDTDNRVKSTVETSKQRKIVSSDVKKKSCDDDKHPAKGLDIPFLIEAPKSFEELSTLLENRSSSDISLIINRIRVCNAIKLAAENRKKMQVFYGVLLQYFAVSADKRPLNIELLDLLVKPLMEMSTEIPYFASICARQRILRTRTLFCEIIKNPDSSCWPSSKTLFLLRLWSLIFPCSDFRHPVMTPAILLMCEYLMRCPIVSGRDIAVGSFLCSMLLSVAKQSQKFCPEAIAFLGRLLMAAKDGKPMPNEDTQYYYLMELKALGPLLSLHGCVSEVEPVNFFNIMDMPEDSSLFGTDEFRASVLMTVIETIQGFVNIYESLSSFPEIFLPISALLFKVADQGNMDGPLRDKLNEVAHLIKAKIEERYKLRKPLQMRRHKPVSIKLLNPRFEESYVKGRDYDPDREKAERRKLKKLLKQESKGAIRELRKDNYFLHEVKAKEKAQMEEERTEKSNQVKAFLEQQQHAFNSGQLGKGRKRRR